MNAEYNKWYKCQEGTMPEDLVGINANGHETPNVLTARKNEFATCGYHLHIDFRIKGNIRWRWVNGAEVLAWMLPEPYKE